MVLLFLPSRPKSSSSVGSLDSTSQSSPLMASFSRPLLRKEYTTANPQRGDSPPVPDKRSEFSSPPSLLVPLPPRIGRRHFSSPPLFYELMRGRCFTGVPHFLWHQAVPTLFSILHLFLLPFIHFFSLPLRRPHAIPRSSSEPSPICVVDSYPSLAIFFHDTVFPLFPPALSAFTLFHVEFPFLAFPLSYPLFLLQASCFQWPPSLSLFFPHLTFMIFSSFPRPPPLLFLPHRAIIPSTCELLSSSISLTVGFFFLPESFCHRCPSPLVDPKHTYFFMSTVGKWFFSSSTYFLFVLNVFLFPSPSSVAPPPSFLFHVWLLCPRFSLPEISSVLFSP